MSDAIRPMLNRLSRLYFTAAKTAENRPRSPRVQRLERDARDLERRIDRAFDRQERQR